MQKSVRKLEQLSPLKTVSIGVSESHFIEEFKDSVVGYTGSDLHYRVMAGDALGVAKMIAKGINPLSLDSNGLSPLQLAAQMGQLACMQTLILSKVSPLSHITHNPEFQANIHTSNMGEIDNSLEQLLDGDNLKSSNTSIINSYNAAFGDSTSISKNPIENKFSHNTHQYELNNPVNYSFPTNTNQYPNNDDEESNEQHKAWLNGRLDRNELGSSLSSVYSNKSRSMNSSLNNSPTSSPPRFRQKNENLKTLKDIDTIVYIDDIEGLGMGVGAEGNGGRRSSGGEKEILYGGDFEYMKGGNTEGGMEGGMSSMGMINDNEYKRASQTYNMNHNEFELNDISLNNQYSKIQQDKKIISDKVAAPHVLTLPEGWTQFVSPEGWPYYCNDKFQV